MNMRFFSLFSAILCFAVILNAQTPSVQLKIKEKSGFLGMGGPRSLKITLSNQQRIQPLSSDNVNSGAFYYFHVTPAEDWQLDDDFVKEELGKIYIFQDGNKTLIDWKSDLIAGGNYAIAIGFPKTFKLHLPFSFQFPIEETVNQAVFIVPQELWPGYTLITDLAKQAESAAATKQYKTALRLYDQILSDQNLQIFPQYEEAKKLRTQCFDGFHNETSLAFQAAAANTQIDLNSRIGLIDALKPNFKMILDSLPRAEWSIGSLDSTVAPILDNCRNSLTHLTSYRDSLQHVLDDQNVKWIIEGSSTGRNGYLYMYMIETLASAFSSINFADTVSTELRMKIPEEYQARLAKYDIALSYETFIRICNERYRMHLPILSVDFLSNLKKDSLSFPLPYYSMMKAVNDFYYHDWTSAKKEIIRIFRTNYDQEINSRFDMLRIIIALREQHLSPDIIKMFEDAEELERAKDIQNAQDKYRQITLSAPNLAYGHFMLGKFYNRTGDPFRALNSFQQAYKIDSLSLSAYRESYSIYFKQSNFKEIINIYTAALTKGNDYWEINYNLGVAYLGEADPARAIKSFERALALNPKSYRTNIQIGLAHQNVKNYQKAREYFNNAIGLDPTRQEAVDYLTKLNEIQRTGR
jgi:tetratricopeptide (TPR) repeat protein